MRSPLQRRLALLLTSVLLAAMIATGCRTKSDYASMPRYTAASRGEIAAPPRVTSPIPVLLPVQPVGQQAPEILPPVTTWQADNSEENCKNGICAPPTPQSALEKNSAWTINSILVDGKWQKVESVTFVEPKSTPLPKFQDRLELSVLEYQRLRAEEERLYYTETLEIPTPFQDGRQEREQAAFLRLLAYYQEFEGRELPDQILVLKESVTGILLPKRIILRWHTRPSR